MTPAPAPAAAPSGEWDFLLSIYAPVMGLDGDVGLGAVGGPVDLPFGDILEDLDASLTVAMEARRGPWSVTGDFFWLKLSTTADLPGEATLDVREQQILSTLSLGYAIYETDRTTLDVLAGAALTYLELDLTLNTPSLPVTERSDSGSRTWIDPYIGLRLRHQLSDRWSILATGMYGGFGVSSDQYWQALAGFNFRMTEHTSLALVYRVIAIDYDRGGLVYDTETSGPNLGLVVRF
jgi:hypothetical protein